MQQELKDTTLARAGHGMVAAVAGAYVGAVLFFVTLGLRDSFIPPQGTEMVWTRQFLSDLFLFSAAGIMVLSWWIVPVGAFFGVYFYPKLSQWPRKTAEIRASCWGPHSGCSQQYSLL